MDLHLCGLKAYVQFGTNLRTGLNKRLTTYEKEKVSKHAPHAAELVAAEFDTVAAAAEECDAQVATGVMPTGVWR